MTVSIIICSRNRAESLAKTLASITSVAVPRDWSVELIVVDNGSTDQTADILKSFRSETFQVCVLTEPTPGLSRARNRGLKAASGNVILFTDDDTRVPENWVTGMSLPILNRHCDALAGGVVFPPHLAACFSRPPLSTCSSWFASTDALDPQKPDRMVGANMAFDRRILRSVEGFDVELGAGALGFGEETLFSWQLKAAGYDLRGAFDVSVEHHFDVGKLTDHNLLEVAYKMGRSRGFLARHWKHGEPPSVRSRLLWHSFRWFYERRRALFFLVRSHRSRPALTPRMLYVNEQLGFCREYLAQKLRPPKYGLQALSHKL